MTVLVGIRCKDGVVIGTDSAATFASGAMRTIEQPSKKISIISNRVIVAGTGEIGLGQRFCALVEAAWVARAFNKSAVEVGKYLCTQAITDFTSTKATNGSYGALVAFPCGDTFELCEFALNNFQPELKRDIWYVSMGSGQAIADPCLGFIRETFWANSRPNCEDGVFAVVWTLYQAIKLNPGGINAPMQISMLSHDSGKPVARALEAGEIEEHVANVEGAIDHLRQYRRLIGETAGGPLPAPPAAG